MLKNFFAVSNEEKICARRRREFLGVASCEAGVVESCYNGLAGSSGGDDEIACAAGAACGGKCVENAFLKCVWANVGEETRAVAGSACFGVLNRID